MDVEIELSKQYPTWNFPNQYYEKEFEISNGKKFSLLQVDSCFLLCETIGKDPAKFLMNLDDHTRKVYESRCEGDQTFIDKGNEMMGWIRDTL